MSQAAVNNGSQLKTIEKIQQAIYEAGVPVIHGSFGLKVKDGKYASSKTGSGALGCVVAGHEAKVDKFGEINSQHVIKESARILACSLSYVYGFLRGNYDGYWQGNMHNVSMLDTVKWLIQTYSTEQFIEIDFQEGFQDGQNLGSLIEAAASTRTNVLASSGNGKSTDSTLQQSKARHDKGLELYKKGKVSINPEGDGFMVNGYVVNTEQVSCECPDHRYRQKPCKHFYAASIFQKFGSDMKVEATEKNTDKRPRLEEAITEINHVLQLATIRINDEIANSLKALTAYD